MNAQLDNAYRKRKVFITGHTGFKGSWLALWLHKLGADVVGYALEPPSVPSHWALLKVPVKSIMGDIRNNELLKKSIQDFQPDIVFHFAAQSLVRLSYLQPHLTYETNVMGTLNILEACRNIPSIRGIVVVTSDKCYENKEWVWGYRESDPMGGYDPYSSSKGCTELLISSYRDSFFNPNEYRRTHQILLASVRAGNVIGGGDWAQDRIIPDIIRATANHKPVLIRNPKAVRPWQHVLDPLRGYLMLGQRLLEGQEVYADAWNFGPSDSGYLTVHDVVSIIKECWNDVNVQLASSDDQPHEAYLLRLDCSKAQYILGWFPVWNEKVSLCKTIDWYKAFYNQNILLSKCQLDEYDSLTSASNRDLRCNDSKNFDRL